MAFLFAYLVGPVALLTALIIAVTYLGGKVFRLPEWEAYFNVELYNLVIAVLLISVCLGFLAASTVVSNSMLGSESITASKTFLNNIINRGVLPMYKDLLVIETGSALSNSFYLRIGPGVWSFVIKVEPGADAIMSMARLMGMGLLAIYTSLSVQYIFLSMVEVATPIILSIGMLAFIFPPTRDAGAFLMMLALAFAVAFPFLYNLNQIILDDMSCQQAMAKGNPCTPYEAYVPEMSLFGIQVRGVQSLSTFLAFAAPVAPFFINFELLVPFINAMAHLALVSLFLPAFAMTLTVALINVGTKFLTGKG